MAAKIYTYDKCDTCRKALRFLRERGINHEVIPIRETPPSETELQTALHSLGNLKRLFNTSGQDYRALGLGEKLAGMSEQEAIQLLRSNGNLVKRPFLSAEGWSTAGFDAEEWAERLT